jgi:hypothetical protein
MEVIQQKDEKLLSNSNEDEMKINRVSEQVCNIYFHDLFNLHVS